MRKNQPISLSSQAVDIQSAKNAPSPSPFISQPRLSREIDWVGSIPFFTVHAIALGILVFADWSLGAWGICLGSYVLRMFGITGGFHRYFSHKTYQTSRFFQFILAFIGGASAQKGALWWAHHHRHHHQHSDDVHDIHSPVQDSFFWSHLGWILSDNSGETDYSKIKDFAKFPELKFINEQHWIPPVAYSLMLYAAFGLQGVLWGFFVSTVFLWHGTFFINSLAHVWGTREYETKDESRNNFWLALITLGEGWHNNHHYFQASTRQGFHWWQLDISYLTLRLLALLGIVWKIREVPPAVLKKS